MPTYNAPRNGSAPRGRVVVRWFPVRASGGREGFAFRVLGVREGGSGVGGFDLQYIRGGENLLDVGTVVVVVKPLGTAKRPRQCADVCEVLEDGTLSVHDSYDWWEESITLKSAVQRLMDEIDDRRRAGPGKAYLAKSFDPDILPRLPCDVRFETADVLPNTGVVDGAPRFLQSGDVLYVPREKRWLSVSILP
jgi:hypothetical protein